MTRWSRADATKQVFVRGACAASDSISEDSSLQAEQIVELEGVLWFVGIVLASRVEYQRKSSLYQSPNGSIQLQLQLSIEPLGCLVL